MSLQTISNSEELFMARAVDLAYQGRGATAPNPCVGAVLVRDDQIVAEGWHTRYGQLHAERKCLADARKKDVDPKGLTMFVTLEPCNHHGKTPPCTDALIEAGIARVVVGTRDPNPVAAGGVEKLLEHGIKVKVGVLEQPCLDLVADFLLWQRSHSPFNILKMAATLDGKIASSQRKPEPVSCPESFARVHEMRARVGAVVIGGNTFYADDPSLTCRKKGLEADFVQPFGVVVTSKLPEDPPRFALLRDRPERAIFMTTATAARSKAADRLRQRGTSVWPLPGHSGGLSLSYGFERLRYDCDCHYTLCEGGGKFALALIEQKLADELVHIVTPRILGDDTAPAAYSGREHIPMSKALNFRILKTEACGTDVILTLRSK
ncbi:MULTISPECIES: bifunctional diaminohydroxyphosphoribosylaminopyrimidine deaminase/5-amino-6-(5-phosphoribosylamino)uracil reductase RibD [unclassified Pseudodesulfovibrio]|uniref:bifunctional diaminohydroxyphosphoribosylaminopyrimidine deaminase/5-amino-6-(5-phosphoribosylamino)uracil reductase RibD n=1 Tax=unclassified Pseudodesulfovibrio TaxID=2661612 RepID=UPI001F4FD25A|nr:MULTISPECIES: bifunctional diaminohydroxyphosphoribosylaminopyrimidine deaminase/5-amino-6-(5-phosphoribosylamino)uracil reductase RibD [unclassified Pseudodesulfovibrio]MCJ2164937.1 bifunctional diaminohydroxyphosphoribosylaminopyrimidine deaminase/5-amino-6-(5-phosphoribosylamino)uracil reductase RibD [Pseudodesulfovibrio sp. S3-i]